MATCNESIAAMSGIGSLPEIIPNTTLPFSSTPATNALFRLQSPIFQTVRFTFNLSSAPNLAVTVFRWTGVPVLIGTVNITNPVSTFTLDFPAGDYIICLRPLGFVTQTGSFVAEFTGYAQDLRFSFDFWEGASTDVILSGPPRPPRECNEALFFDIIEGELPPGLIMDSLGTISGWLPNLDCLEDSPSPAVNWYYEENDGTVWPWGREWRFRVRVHIAGMEESSSAEEWFCVRIHNNWTFDAENFMSQAPFVEVKEVKVVEPGIQLPDTLCQPCKNFEEEAMFIPQPIEQTCAPCASPNQTTSVELIAIPVDLCQIPPNDFLPWYESNKDIDSGNPFIEKFKRDLEFSQAFQLLRARSGFVEADPDQPLIEDQEFVMAMNYQNFLQLARVRLNENADPNSLAVLLRQWRDIENQALPTTGYNYSGETMEISLV